MSSAGIAFTPVRFSTADLPACNRLAILREEFGRQIIRVDMEPVPDRPLQAEVSVRWLPGLRVATLNTTGLRVARTPEMIAVANEDVFCFLMGFGEATMVSLRGHSVTLGQGDAVLLCSWEPITSTHLGAQLVNVMIPRAALAPLVANVEDAILRVIPLSTQALRLLPTYLQAVRDEQALASPELRHAVVTHVHDLVSLAIGATKDGAAIADGRGLRAARLQAVKADILDNFGRRDLSIDQVARRQHISPRHIRRLLKAEETTFSEFVLGIRLAKAHRMLSDPRSAERTISAVAFECGFGDLSYFNRTFRRHYRMTPSEVRARALWQDDAGRGLAVPVCSGQPSQLLNA